ncbi:phage tail protein [Actinopolymorpha alba]|uniref:phage tail protein n=1 Tax=Actinopolymorpha alba TaxID=533267 RepID=UPI000377D448|nr:phage tail protein [Actinopolymorpha alba]
MAETTARPAASPGTTIDPYRDYNFKLIIDGITVGHFTRIIDLEARVERLSYREAGNNAVVRAIPGRVTYGPVVLEAGLTSSRAMWEWLMSAVNHQQFRRSVYLLVLDPSGSQEVMRWHLRNAWPQAWKAPTFDAMGNGIAIEALVIAHEGIVREEGGGGATPAA